jgi:phospholipid transport system substrate-binding protein
MKKLLVSILFLVPFSALAETDPEALVRQAADKMIALLEENKERLKTDELLAHAIVREQLLPLIDTQGLGKRLLKRKVWNQLTKQQRNRFTDAFINHLINTYAKGLANYDGHRFNFIKTEYSTSRQTAWVYSEILSKNKEAFSIIYTLKKMETDDDWKVIDVSVEGIKILQNYREQLKTVDVSDSFEALLAKIESNENQS